MRRSMSLETCRVSENQDGGFSSVLYGGRGGGDGDRQTSSLKLRCNPPETIPEEEMERIRRESLVPHVGLLAGDGRRRSSAVGLDSGQCGSSSVSGKTSAPKLGSKAEGSTGPAGGRRSSTAVFSSGFKNAAKTFMLPKPPGNTSNNLKAAPIFSDDAITLMAEDSPSSQVKYPKGEDEGRAASEADSCYSQRRDEGLGESFDRYSEVSGYGNGSGGAGETLIELHTLSTNSESCTAKPPSPASSTSSLVGPVKNSVRVQPIPGFPVDSTVVSANTARPHSSPKTKNNNISKRKVSSSSSTPGESRRKKSDDLSPDGDKAFLNVSRSLPLASSQDGGDDSEHESSGGENGIDPLFFLSELQSKRVTFM
ncbi:hypothetical protein ElyMa_001162500 [Elysia marginata]|uniref:CARMIL C-terminal domain-containing protein n=1 Tax=Elysia marginata TaxID=1093978 RepID=A0AAV4I4P8_9GAST|nr:hypothetical protein ElyMa_001162500 [Elysia marginata]